MSSSFTCDCSCVASGTRDRHRHASVEAVVIELHFLAHANASACQRTCPALAHFQGLLRAGGPSQILLRDAAASQYADNPCDGSMPAHRCVAMHAWRLVRLSTLLTDLTSLAACDGDGEAEAELCSLPWWLALPTCDGEGDAEPEPCSLLLPACDGEAEAEPSLQEDDIPP